MFKHHNNSDLVDALNDSLEGTVEIVEFTDIAGAFETTNHLQIMEGYRFEHLKMSIDYLSYEHT